MTVLRKNFLYNFATETERISKVKLTTQFGRLWCPTVATLRIFHKHTSHICLQSATSLTSHAAARCHLYLSQRHEMRWLRPRGFPQSFAQKSHCHSGPIVRAEGEASTSQSPTTQTTGRCVAWCAQASTGCAEVEATSPGNDKLFITLLLKIDPVFHSVFFFSPTGKLYSCYFCLNSSKCTNNVFYSVEGKCTNCSCSISFVAFLY